MDGGVAAHGALNVGYLSVLASFAMVCTSGIPRDAETLYLTDMLVHVQHRTHRLLAPVDVALVLRGDGR